MRIIETDFPFQKNIAFEDVGVAVCGTPGFEIDHADPPRTEAVDSDGKVTAVDDTIADGCGEDFW